MRIVLGVDHDLGIVRSLGDVIGNVRIRRIDACKGKLEPRLLAQLAHRGNGRRLAGVDHSAGHLEARPVDTVAVLPDHHELPFAGDGNALRADPRFAELRAHIWNELRAQPARAA